MPPFMFSIIYSFIHSFIFKTDTWYKFNDEEIEKMQNKLKLSGEDESGIVVHSYTTAILLIDCII